MTTQTKSEASALENGFQEAPASWNTRYVHPSGFECQITLRCETGSELLEKVEKAIEFLLAHGCQPYVYSRGSATKPAVQSNGSGQRVLCRLHGVEMKRFEKDGRSWYSHRTENGWCKGK